MKNLLFTLFYAIILNCFSQNNGFDTICNLDKKPLFKLQVKQVDVKHFELCLINISKTNIYIVKDEAKPISISEMCNEIESTIQVGLCDNPLDDISFYELTKLKKQKIYITKFTSSKKSIILKVSIIISNENIVHEKKKFYFKNPEYYSKIVVFTIPYKVH